MHGSGLEWPFPVLMRSCVNKLTLLNQRSFGGIGRHPSRAANMCVPDDPSKFPSPNSWWADLQDAAGNNYKYTTLWRASPITLPTSHQILNDLTALPDEGNTTQVLLEPFTGGIPNKIGNEADLGKQGTQKQEQSWLIGEAVTDSFVDLPDKFTALKLLFLDAFSQNGWV